jgi:ribosomal protein L37AE/L43A
MYWHETLRCPVCKRKGHMRTQYGSYFCDPCDQRFGLNHITLWNKAFDEGVEWQKSQPFEPTDVP